MSIVEHIKNQTVSQLQDFIGEVKSPFISAGEDEYQETLKDMIDQKGQIPSDEDPIPGFTTTNPISNPSEYSSSGLDKLSMIMARSVTYVIDVFHRVVYSPKFSQSNNLRVTLILMDLPTLFFMTAFSIFIYYFSKLTIQVEQFKNSNMLYAPLVYNNPAAFQDKTQALLERNSQQNSGYLDRSNDQNKTKLYKSPNLMKPFFIIFNIFTYFTYITICIYCKFSLINILVFQHQLNSPPNSQTVLPDYFRAMSGLNGLAFLMLALAIMNYGWKLEAIIQKTKQECELTYQQSRQPTQSLKASPQRRPTNVECSDINEQSKKILSGLDQRIFLLTVFLSVLFFIISFSELLQAWDIIAQFNEKWTAVIFFTFTEFIPSLVIAHYLSMNGSRRRRKRGGSRRKRIGNILGGGANQQNQRFESNYSESDGSFTGDEENLRAFCDGETSSGEDSFGSFNPNYQRYKKEKTGLIGGSFEKNLNNFSEESEKSDKQNAFNIKKKRLLTEKFKINPNISHN